MTIEEQLAVFLRDHLFECGASVEGQTVYCDDERIPVGSRFKCSCRSGAHELLAKFLPLIAAELAGVAREHAWRNQNLLGEKTFIFPATRIKESIRTAEHIALAIEAHARKRGEA